MEQRDSFVFYRSFRDAFAELRPNDRLVIYEAIANYALDGVEPDLRGVTRGYWQLIRPQIDANYKRFQSGRRGGRPRKPRQETEKTETVGFEGEKPTDTGHTSGGKTDGGAPEKPNANANANVNVNVNANGNANANGAAFPPGGLGAAPGWAAVEEYCRQRGYDRALGERWYETLSQRDWTVDGKPLRCWQRHLDSWALRSPAARGTGYSFARLAAELEEET